MIFILKCCYPSPGQFRFCGASEANKTCQTGASFSEDREVLFVKKNHISDGNVFCPQIFSVQRCHPELVDDLLHPHLPLARLRLHRDRAVPGGGGGRGLDGPARHTEQTGQQDAHLAFGNLQN